jgi:hypothetical protein
VAIGNCLKGSTEEMDHRSPSGERKNRQAAPAIEFVSRKVREGNSWSIRVDSSVNLYIWIERSKVGVVNIATTRSLVVGFVPIAAPLFAVHQRDSTLWLIARTYMSVSIGRSHNCGQENLQFSWKAEPIVVPVEVFSRMPFWCMRLIR